MKRPHFLALLVVFSGDALLSMLPLAELHSFNAFAKKPGGGCSGQSCSALPPTSQGCAVHGSGQNVLHNPHCRGTSTSTTETPGGTPSTTATTKETTVTDNHQETTDPGTSGGNTGGGTPPPDPKQKDPAPEKQKIIVVTGTYGEVKTYYSPVLQPNVPPEPQPSGTVGDKTPPLPLHPTVTFNPTYKTFEGYSPVHNAPNGGGTTGGSLSPPIIVTGHYETFTGYGPVSSLTPDRPVTTHTQSPNRGQTKILTYRSHAKTANHSKFDLFSARTGPSMIKGHRSQFIEPSGKTWTCALSGMGRRKIINEQGLEEIVGNAETLHFQQTATAHLPSNHRSEARCIVLINKQATNIDEIRSNLSGE